jgi:alpha-1,2-mannosyltransferase
VQAAASRSRSRRAPFRLRHGRLLLRVSTVAVTAVAAWSFVVAPLLGHFGGRFEDFSAYLGAARSMAAGHSPYASFNGNVSVVMTGFDYPPFAALLVRPLALLSDSAAVTLWLWISVACTVTGALVLARTVLPARWPRTELALLAAFAFGPAGYNYWHGQMNPVIFLLLALSLRSYVEDKEVQTGVLLGLAAAIKLSPVVLLLGRRWWRGTAAMVATIVASVVTAVPVIGVGGVRTFVDTVLPSLARDTGWIYNQSVGGLLSRAADHSVLRVGSPSALLHTVVLGAAVVILGVCLWTVRPGHRDRAERGAEFGLGVTAMLLAASIAWYPHFTHLLIPLAAAAGLVVARGWHVERRLAQAALGGLAVFGVLVPVVVANIDMGTMQRLSASGAWWPALQVFSIPCLATIALFIALVRSLGPRTPAGDP